MDHILFSRVVVCFTRNRNLILRNFSKEQFIIEKISAGDSLYALLHMRGFQCHEERQYPIRGHG
jgi:hypothetical protein